MVEVADSSIDPCIIHYMYGRLESQNNRESSQKINIKYLHTYSRGTAALPMALAQTGAQEATRLSALAHSQWLVWKSSYSRLSRAPDRPGLARAGGRNASTVAPPIEDWRSSWAPSCMAVDLVRPKQPSLRQPHAPQSRGQRREQMSLSLVRARAFMLPTP